VTLHPEELQFLAERFHIKARDATRAGDTLQADRFKWLAETYEARAGRTPHAPRKKR
jgi:hypothetical protein